MSPSPRAFIRWRPAFDFPERQRSDESSSCCLRCQSGSMSREGSDLVVPAAAGALYGLSEAPLESDGASPKAATAFFGALSEDLAERSAAPSFGFGGDEDAATRLARTGFKAMLTLVLLPSRTSVRGAYPSS